MRNDETKRRPPRRTGAVTATFDRVHLRRTLNGAPANHERARQRAHREFGFRFVNEPNRRDELSWIRSYGYDSTEVDWSLIARAIAEVDRPHPPQHREVVAEDVCVLHLDLELGAVA